MKFNTFWVLMAIISGVILIIKILTPSVVQLVVERDGNFHIYQIPNVYTFGDIIIVIAMTVMFSYAIFKIFLKEKIILPTKLNAEQIITILKKDELKVYELIERQGSISQSDISKELGFSKTKVSNIVDLLEAYG